MAYDSFALIFHYKIFLAWKTPNLLPMSTSAGRKIMNNHLWWIALNVSTGWLLCLLMIDVMSIVPFCRNQYPRHKCFLSSCVSVLFERASLLSCVFLCSSSVSVGFGRANDCISRLVCCAASDLVGRLLNWFGYLQKGGGNSTSLVIWWELVSFFGFATASHTPALVCLTFNYCNADGFRPGGSNANGTENGKRKYLPTLGVAGTRFTHPLRGKSLPPSPSFPSAARDQFKWHKL